MVPELYLSTTIELIRKIDTGVLARMASDLVRLRERSGRLFIIGNGGGQAHAVHAAADFRKIAGIESYAWGENAADLTAYVNDEGWDNSVRYWLKNSHFRGNDALMVFSVGGMRVGVSENLYNGVRHAVGWGATILGITGQPGYLATHATTHIVFNANTPQTEGLQAVVWHCLVDMLRR